MRAVMGDYDSNHKWEQERVSIGLLFGLIADVMLKWQSLPTGIEGACFYNMAIWRKPNMILIEPHRSNTPSPIHPA